MNWDFAAFRTVDFNWVHDLQSVWSEPPGHVDELHSSLRERIVSDFFSQTKRRKDNPIGKVISGEAGVGKTHLIGSIRHEVWKKGGWFVLLDIVGITDFWATTAHGFLNSLCQHMPCGRQQCEAVLSAILKTRASSSAVPELIRWQETPSAIDTGTVRAFLNILRQVDSANTQKHQDVVRALLLLGDEDFDASNLAHCWLQGLDSDEGARRRLGFLAAPPKHAEIVRGILWVMSFAGPTLIAVDQIDSIVSASNLLSGHKEDPLDETERKARAIIQLLAGGLMDLHDVKQRAMTSS